MSRRLRVFGAVALTLAIGWRFSGRSERDVTARSEPEPVALARAPILITEIELAPEAPEFPRPDPGGPSPRSQQDPGPKPTASAASAASEARTAPGRGEVLLREGVFPRLRATYDRIGFPAYRDAVVALGGAFFLFDLNTRRPVEEIDPRTGVALGVEVRGDLSRWPRDVTRHLSQVLVRGRARSGPAVSHVILLPPARLDAALLGELDRHLSGRGLDVHALLRVDVAYEIDDRGLFCEVLEFAFRDGRTSGGGLRIDLSSGTTG